MRNETFSADILKRLLLKSKVATMQELKASLKTPVTMTVLRKLDVLSYQTSYSHSGKFYTLSEIPKYDKNGLWSYNNIYFSEHNTLIETVRAFVTNSTEGYSRNELEELLHVKVQEQLYQLYKNNLLCREKINQRYIYFAKDSDIYRRQKSNRNDFFASTVEPVHLGGEILAHELKAAIILFFTTLDEQQRRLYAGLESLKLGHGGDNKISELLLINPHTVAKGRKELLNQDVDVERIRKGGGGRHAIEKKHQKSLKG